MIDFSNLEPRWYVDDDHTEAFSAGRSRRNRFSPMPVGSQCRMTKARQRAKSRRRRPKWLAGLAALLWMLLAVGTSSTSAFPILTQQLSIAPSCDPLNIPVMVDELGFPAIFPPDERIIADTTTIQTLPPCPQFNNPAIADPLIQAVNLTTTTFTQVWYVADPQTRISNVDGLANELIAGFGPSHEAFRIDRLISDPTGSHHPLRGESIIPDGLWQPGEIWRFVLQDYQNSFGLPPHLFTTRHIGDATVPMGISTGSIIAVPEPVGPFIAIVVGVFACGWSRCRRRSHPFNGAVCP